MADVISKEEFEAMEPRDKGFIVYMCGCRDDQPNVPEEHTPAPDDAAAYAVGQHAAVIIAQDNP